MEQHTVELWKSHTVDLQQTFYSIYRLCRRNHSDSAMPKLSRLTRKQLVLQFYFWPLRIRKKLRKIWHHQFVMQPLWKCLLWVVKLSWLKKLLVCVIYSWQWITTVSHLESVNLCSNQSESSLKKKDVFLISKYLLLHDKYNNKSVALKSHTFETITVYLDLLTLLLIYASGLVLLPLANWGKPSILPPFPLGLANWSVIF